MLFKTLFTIIALFILSYLSSSLVINEVLYDPVGSDGGWEWIEIFNGSGEMVNLEQWIIQKAGTEFDDIYVFPYFELEPGSYLLLGEESVENTDLITELAFQNGGSATDGIRIISPEGDYTDTVLYDFPNTNSLPDDYGNIGSTFAPDVSSGHSLARVVNGVDSNDSELDFFECENPTPGVANFFPIDLELTSAQIVETEEGIQIITVISNLSTINVDNFEATLNLYINSELEEQYPLPQINGGENIDYIINQTEIFSGYDQITVSVNYLYDNELENNSIQLSHLEGYPPLIFNEIMLKPEQTQQEWVEIFNTTSSEFYVDNFLILDASNGEIRFSCLCGAGEYLVICQDEEALLSTYPDMDATKIIISECWTPLNNSEETLTLLDSCGTVFEEFCYWGTDCPEGVSLERINPFLVADPENWVPSVAGATPGLPNSVYIELMPESAGVNINPNPFSPYRDENTIITYCLPRLLNRVTLRIFDLKGRLVRTLVDQIVQSARGEFIWDGRDKEDRKLLPGVYILLMEAVTLDTEKVYRLEDTIVLAH